MNDDKTQKALAFWRWLEEPIKEPTALQRARDKQFWLDVRESNRAEAERMRGGWARRGQMGFLDQGGVGNASIANWSLRMVAILSCWAMRITAGSCFTWPGMPSVRRDFCRMKITHCWFERLVGNASSVRRSPTS